MIRQQVNFKVTDWLRGLAALYVTISHCRSWLYAGGRYYETTHPLESWTVYDKAYHAFIAFTKLSTEFVILFFLISGFSIAHSLSSNPSLKDFYLRRMIRIYPPYLFGVLWAVIVFIIAARYSPSFFACTLPTTLFEGLCEMQDFLTPGHIIQNIFFIPYGVIVCQFWSITHEVIFYLLVPLFIINRNIYFIGSALAYAASWFIEGWAFDNGNILQAYFLHINFYFAAGVFLYSRLDQVKKFLPASALFYVIALPALLALMFAVNILFGGTTKISGAVSAVFAFLLLFRCLDKNIIIRPLVFIGEFSYSLYITHVASILLFMVVLERLSLADFPVTERWLWVPAIPFCIGISYVAWLLVEKNAQKLKKFYL